MSVADADEHTTDRAMRKITLALWLIATPALGQQITAFPAASTPLAGTEQIYLVQAGQPRQTTVGQLPFNVSGPFLPLAGNKTVTGPVTFSGTLSATAGINATPYVAIGVPGATTGQIFLSNTTGGILTLQAPATGMLGSDVLTIPIPAGSTDTFALLGTAQTFTSNPTFSGFPAFTGGAGVQPAFTVGIIGSQKGVIGFANGTNSGRLALAPPATGALNDSIITLPIPTTTTDTLALLGTPQTFSATQTFSGAVVMSNTVVIMSGLPTSCSGLSGTKQLANISGTLTVC